MLAEFQPLPLVRRADSFPVKQPRPFQQALKHEAGDHLAMLHDERDLMGPHFEHCPRTVDIARSVTESWIEKTRIVDTKLPDRGIERHHLSGVLRGDPHALARCQNVEILRIENQRVAVVAPDRVPELIEIVVLNSRQIDERRMLLRAIAAPVWRW